MEKIKNGIITLLIWLVTFLLLAFTFADLAAMCAPVYVIIILFCPVAVALSYATKRAPKSKKYSEEDFKIPLTKKGCKELAASLRSRIQTYTSMARDSDNFALFIECYDEVWRDTWKLTQLEHRVHFTGTEPTYELKKLDRDFQWHLRDAMERHKDKIVRESRSLYKNYPERTVEEYEKFSEYLERYQERFDDGTVAFGEKMLDNLKYSCNFDLGVYNNSCNGSDDRVPISIDNDIDAMDGHTFEFFCADVMRKIGYTNVVVTPGSGDQGVDITAEKDGIKYAVQCKCYASDLGNTPVQEVFTGKQFYGCHVGAVLTNRHFTQGAKDAAKATGILLWDRETLMRMIEQAAAFADNVVGAEDGDDSKDVSEMETDEMFSASVDVILETGQASVSMLERRLKLGYSRAARIMDEMEAYGVVGEFEGSRPRQILITKEQWARMKTSGGCRKFR